MSVSTKISAFRRATDLSAGSSGYLRMTEVLVKTRVNKALGRSASTSGAIAVPMKDLGGRRLYIRPGTSDLQNATEYYKFGLPLPVLEAGIANPRQMVELGCNIGVSLSSLATHFPTANLLGIEPDADNAAMARRNTGQFGDRCTIVESAIWDEPAELVLSHSTGMGANGISVRVREDSDPVDLPSIAALDLDSLLATHMPEGEIDHMLVNIEGTEPRFFAKGGDWVSRVRSLKVETQPEVGYFAADCIAQLEQLGFRAWPYEPFPKFVAAVRP
jgi:hypothetical protein